jgi:hypothetical protein
VHAPCEDKSNDVKDSFYKGLGHVFDQFRTYNTNTLLGDFNAKVDRKNIFTPITRNDSPHKISNDNGVRVVNFDTPKN